jgi:sugar phosphate isomerase/epimerase
MRLELFRHLWGVAGSWEESFARARSEGFSGIECGVPAPQERPRLRSALERHGFSFIAQIFTAGDDVAGHVRSFATQVAEAAACGPCLINAHSGCDSWSQSEAMAFFDAALVIERSCGIAIAHETHRGRILYNPWTTRDLLLAQPALRLTCDYSHWVCVAERLLDGEQAVLRLCAERALHIHARVGYEEGPQVSDPRAPEFRRHLEAHERWWDMIWDCQDIHNLATTSATPEYGPPDYLHTLPYTCQPVADLAGICAWQAQRLAERFSQGGWRGSYRQSGRSSGG